MLGISWFHPAAYCNWLSKQEGLPESEWCYEPLRDAKAMPALAADPEYKVGMKLAANYLKRSGYRLPTETEMEFATRAGSVTSRFYGETEELLPNYAWYNKNGQDRAGRWGARSQMIWACSTCRATSSHGVRSDSKRIPIQRKRRSRTMMKIL